MTVQIPPNSDLPDESRLTREALRILPRLSEASAVLAVAAEMEKAVVVREDGTGSSTRTAVVDRGIAEAMALKNWIDCAAPGRISRYHITAAGRAALARLLAEAESRAQGGFAEAPVSFAPGPGRDPAERAGDAGPTRRARYGAPESPLMLLARRKDRNGKPFLSADLVSAGERLREDFELSQMGARGAQNWHRFLAGADAGGAPFPDVGSGAGAARDRVAGALRDLGPGLGDVALRCCCYLEGLETAEKRMGWSARSGKIVLRIALQRLKLHYDGLGESGAMIG